MKTFFMAVLCLFVHTIFPESTGHIAGQIIDKQTRTGIPQAQISVETSAFHTVSNANGTYELKDLPAGTYTLSISAEGYSSKILPGVIVSSGNTVRADAELDVERSVLSAVVTMCEKMMVKSDAISSGIVCYPNTVYQLNDEDYASLNESGYYSTLKKPLSTFSSSVDAASYTNARRIIMSNYLPPRDAVRSEEFINYFTYNYKAPEKNQIFSITTEFADCPWNPERKIVGIGIQGKKIIAEERKPSNLVFLIDISGSMDSPNKLPLLISSLKILVENLRVEDRVSIVVYASDTRVVLQGASGNEKERIYTALNQLSAGGSTAGGAGIQLAYNAAKENFIKGGINRVILATDGDFNVGISSTAELVRYIEKERKSDIYITILGLGMGNFKDSRLQEIAKNGNGNYFYIDNMQEAKNIFSDHLTATLFTIAKDVKIQVEFNPAKISSYRLIGYENRKLEDQDFKNEEKDAGEIGAGHCVTALYEVVLTSDAKMESDDLKYSTTNIKPRAYKSDEYLTVKIRYKLPDSNKSIEQTGLLTESPKLFKQSSENLQFASAVAEFSMLLRDSEYKASSSYTSCLDIARSARGIDANGSRLEFILLVEKAKQLAESHHNDPAPLIELQ